MSGVVEEARVFEWEGGPFDELLALLAEAALTAKVEVVRPGSGQKVGDLQIIAGGVLDSTFGDERGDPALAAIKRIPGLRFRISPALPHPDEGSLDPEGPSEGSVASRPVAALMRYCEDYVLTGALEISRGAEHARISYRRGEIVRTLVDGSEAAERLPDVIGWTEGQWKIVLPQVNLPRPRKPAPTAAPGPSSGTLFGFPAPVIPGVTTAAAAPPAPMSALVTEPPGRPATPRDSVTVPESGGPTITPPMAAGLPPTPAVAPPLATPAAEPGMTQAAAATPAVSPTASAPPPARPSHELPTMPNELVVSVPPTPIDVPVALPASRPPPPSAPVPRPIDETKATPPPRFMLPLPPPTRPRPTPRGFTSLPLVVHVLLGVALGAAIVAGYWAYLSWPLEGIPGLR